MMSYQKDLQYAHDLLDAGDEGRTSWDGGYPHQMIVLGRYTIEATLDHDGGPELRRAKNTDLVKAIRKCRKWAAQGLGPKPDPDEYEDAVIECFREANPME